MLGCGLSVRTCTSTHPLANLEGVRLNLLRTPAGYVVDVAGQSSPARHTLSELFQDAEMEITEAALPGGLNTLRVCSKKTIFT